MNVWLWDAVGSGGHSGVTDDESRALSAAEACLTDGRATTARVEMADMHAGGMWINSGYERYGSGLTATRANDGSVRWTRFCRPALAVS